MSLLLNSTTSPLFRQWDSTLEEIFRFHNGNEFVTFVT